MATLHAPAPERAQKLGAFLLVIEALRWDAARVMSAAFPGELDRFTLPGLPATTLSKARNGSRCTALFRVDLCIAGLAWGGASRDQAQLLADHVQDAVDRFYPEEVLDPLQLSLIEARWQAAADPLQLAFQGGDESVRLDLVDRLRRHRAALSSYIVALLARPKQSERSIAA